MNLLDQHCIDGAAALDPATIRVRLTQVPEWQAIDGTIARDYAFPDYRATIAFVNAVASMAEEQNHHPDMTVGYRRCTLAYTTHSAGGALSDNDFICAAKADALYKQQAGA
ncbi:4a-hydroxytetrahydrobiopterin dehydratase [Massilia sp. IC2-477]|uniref:4a-hydroxytetrahydrobiopterin dehydratase n=1 Tax=unclassified Massilia TaxID=2609279 RepID=UPI001D0F5BF5|nr:MULTISPECIES: 4a-hydroxytetrahydrobiopterin dehydratase [unclassified Massilia]MCC2956500.1 4a-hydroxytetrahydrobiopterin dehydratase [Massilia sp. IC2-477]MCC2972135.1 4a-hydroxytetrahydrobiopterin dehydratase [Massilia sp. IC2-476]